MFCIVDSNCILSVALENKSQLIAGDKNTAYILKMFL